MKLVLGLFPKNYELEEQLVHLEQVDEKYRDALVALEVNKCRFKAQYDNYVHPQKFSEGDLVLLYDQSSELLGAGNFNLVQHGPYVVKWVLEKGSYEL